MNSTVFPPNLDFEHLSRLSFEEKGKVHKKGLVELQEGRISQEALDRGEKYRGKIEGRLYPKTSVRFISDEVGHGVFAEEAIQKGAFVGEYVGVVRENIRIYFAPLNNYCYEYPVPDSIGRSYVIDATKGNFTRFINHSFSPNLEPVYAFYDGFYHLIFLSLKEIKKGEQLLYNYGRNYWMLRSVPQEFYS